MNITTGENSGNSDRSTEAVPSGDRMTRLSIIIGMTSPITSGEEKVTIFST